jgi:hypothetical protein
MFGRNFVLHWRTKIPNPKFQRATRFQSKIFEISPNSPLPPREGRISGIWQMLEEDSHT